MSTQAHEATAASTEEAPVTVSALTLAFGSVGVGLVTVAALIHGLMSLGQSPDATLWSIGGLLAYLAVWIWGMVFARRS